MLEKCSTRPRKNLWWRLCVIFVSILFFENGAGRIFKNVNVVKYIDDFERYSLDDNGNAGEFQQDQDFDNEISYPYEELRDIVKKTRKLLLENREYRNILKFDAAYDDAYLARSDQSRFFNDYRDVEPMMYYTEDHAHSLMTVPQQEVVFRISKQKKVKSKVADCGFVTEVARPQTLINVTGTAHLILNLGNEFVQEVNIVSCVKGEIGVECGRDILLPEAYNGVCKQSYRVYKLLSIPNTEMIDISSQVVSTFRLPSGCHCAKKHW